MASGELGSSSATNNNEAEMTYGEKCRLNYDISTLPGDKLVSIMKIVQDHEPSLRDAEEVKIDLQKFKNSTLKEIEKFVAGCLNKDQVNED